MYDIYWTYSPQENKMKFLYHKIFLVIFLIWSFKHVMVLLCSIVMIALNFSYCTNFPLPDGKSCLLWPWWHSTWNCQFLLVKVILNKMWLKLVFLFHYFIWVVCYVLILIFFNSLVQCTFEDLEDSECIMINEDSVEPTMLGSVASQYYLKHTTISMFGSNLGPDISLEVSITFGDWFNSICVYFN